MLIGDQGQVGDSNRPRLAADAACQGDTLPTSGQRETAACQAPTIAETAAANDVAASAGGTGSTPVSTRSRVKYTRTYSALRSNRRSQPLTVSAGRPSRAAIDLAPAPDAFHASAAPITSAKSTRLTSANTGRSTCEPPQPMQRARRGLTRTTPSTARSTRRLAQPHGASTPPQSGHSISPVTSLVSTRPASASTVSTGASKRVTALPDSAKRSSGGPSHALLRQGVAADEHTNHTSMRPNPSAHSMPSTRRPRRHFECRPTPQGLTEFEHLHGDTMRPGPAPATPAEQEAADARASLSTPAASTSTAPRTPAGDTPSAPPPAGPRTAGSRAL